MGTSPIDLIYESGLVKDGHGFVCCFLLILWSRIAILLNRSCVRFTLCLFGIALQDLKCRFVITAMNSLE